MNVLTHTPGVDPDVVLPSLPAPRASAEAPLAASENQTGSSRPSRGKGRHRARRSPRTLGRARQARNVPSPAMPVPGALPVQADVAPDVPQRKPNRWVDHVLSLLALVGVLMTGVTVAASVSGLRPLVVKSGSMEPIIATGGMVLVREIPAADIRVGDVVAVERPDHTRVTHRVMEVEHKGVTAELVLKGDANEDNDPIPVTVTEAGKMVYTAPWMGRISAFLTSARGGFTLGCIITGVVLTVVRRKDE